MKVTLLAHTYFCGNNTQEDIAETGWIPDNINDVEDIDSLAEFAGRACYQSWSRPNPETATNAGYLKNILKQGHESVLEHASATFYIEGVSRSLTHELIRHRHLSFSQLSQRYVDESLAEFVIPPAVQDYLTDADVEAMKEEFRYVREGYSSLADVIEGCLPNEWSGHQKRKAAREAARAVLPNGTATKILVTGNMRAWRDVLKKRWHVAADAEIRNLAGELLRQLREIAPNSFQDIPEKPYGSEE